MKTTGKQIFKLGGLGDDLGAKDLGTVLVVPRDGGNDFSTDSVFGRGLLVVVAGKEGAGVAGLGGFVAQRGLAGEGSESVEGGGVVGCTARDDIGKIKVKDSRDVLTRLGGVGGDGDHKVEGKGGGRGADTSCVQGGVQGKGHLVYIWSGRNRII